MTRTFAPIDLVALPRLDAVSAAALAQQVITAAGDKAVAKVVKKEASIAALLPEIGIQRDQLQAANAVAAQAMPAGKKAEADRREDLGYGALVTIVGGWAKLDGEHPLGTVAAKLRDGLFAEGISRITNMPVAKEWSAVDAKLKLIDGGDHTPALASLGLKPALDHLRAVHAAYGAAVGATEVLPEVEPALVRDRREALLDTLRDYVLQVSAAVRRKTKPLDPAVGDKLLRPIAQWTSADAVRAAAEPVTPAAAPEAPPAEPKPA